MAAADSVASMSASSPRIHVTQTQRLSLNTGLQAAIRVLRLDAGGLTRYLEEQAADNPFLRLDPAPVPLPGDWLPRWSQAFQTAGAGGGSGGVFEAEAPPASLMAHVASAIEQQVHTARDRRIAHALAEALEPSGWLGRSLAAVALDTGASEADVAAVLVVLQRIEPTGLFARNLAECLALQLAEAGQLDPVMQCILDHLGLLAAGDFARLARLCRCPETEVALRFRLIRRLNPKPGAQFAAFAMPPLREPDLLARRGIDGWDVALNRSSLPGLRIAPRVVGADPVLRAQAQAVSRMVTARNATLLRVGQQILQVQVAALEQGPGALLPLSMADVGAALDLHESTISRVVAGASVDTPRGTWWLRHLFSGRIGESGLSAAAIRDRLARLIADEPPMAPLSDAALAERLSVDGAVVARRTVAKYRGLLNLAPAHRRKRAFAGRG